MVITLSPNMDGVEFKFSLFLVNIVLCLANLASHVTTIGLFKQSIIYPREGSWPRSCDLKVGQRSRSDRHCHRRDRGRNCPNMQKVIMTEKPSLPKNWRVTFKDSYKKKTRRKSKRTSTIGEKRERRERSSYRERKTWSLRERVTESWD